jgi:hypothetical protein
MPSDKSVSVAVIGVIGVVLAALITTYHTNIGAAIGGGGTPNRGLCSFSVHYAHCMMRVHRWEF